ncbi:hypothetical protein CHS0354_026059 [Potamilus streckersoni]|uniref:DH domain-containing protein n=1 Tax=Potamilus streckersoni TaxID=2493646 RepID=A0AAE0VUZ6_9BIVA|nr:hypothetical protein CHS0354_026059 [Potamilus streckersoni]
MEDYIYEEVTSYDEEKFPVTTDENEQRITSEIGRLNMEDIRWSEDDIYEDIDLPSYRPPSSYQDTDISELTETQIKVRHVIQSLIDTEQSYIDCLDKLVKEYQPTITSLFSTRPQVMKAFIYLRLMFIHHVKSQDMLKNRSCQNVASFFRQFAEQEIVNLYSMYINCYSVAIDVLKEAEKTKPAFRDFLKAQCTLSIEALMLRPVQRFPQFILILKDLLKYGPDDDVYKPQLHDCLALLEHAGYQLNERKRRSEQTLQAQSLYTKLKLRPNAERGSHRLIRQDDVRQLSNKTNGKQPTKERRLLLMNACLVSTCLSSRESDDYTFKWSVGLQNLELQEQSMTLGLEVNSKQEEHADNVTELNSLKDDYSTLEQMNSLSKTLNKSYPDLLDSLRRNIRALQQNIQKTFNTTGIELIDSSRNRTYTFLFDNSKTKLEWCTDFLMSKNMADYSNTPAWSVQQGASTDSAVSPACFIRHLSADIPRQFTKIKCATQVIMPDSYNPSIGLPHLWVCSGTEGLGKVSIISFYSGRPNLLESFQACQCEIVCAEIIPGSSQVQHKLIFSMDTVWMGTVDSEIIVFAVSSPQNVTRAPIHIFHTKAVVMTLKYINDRVFAGCRTGTLLIFNRDEDGVWTESSSVVIGNTSVSSLVSWKSDIWIGCNKSITVFEADSLNRKASIDLQTEEECEGTINCMEQVLHGLWVSYNGKAIMRLYHMDSGKLLQEYDISVDLSTFCADSLKGYCEFQSSLKYEITSLLSSPGSLWVGTSSGIILNYPIVLYQDTGPKIFMKPNISMYGCYGSSKFFSILPFGSVASKSGSNRVLDLHFKQEDHKETLPKHEDSAPTASDISTTETPLYDSHVYMTLLPESSAPSKVHESGQICSSDTIQMQGNSEPITGKDEPCTSLVGNVCRKSLISNNPFVLQDKSNNTLVENQSQKGISELGKSPKVVEDSPIVSSCHENKVQHSTRNSSAFVANNIPEERTEPLKRRADSGYGSTKRVDVNKLPSSSSPNSFDRLVRVPSGVLRRQSAVRKSRTQSIRRSVSSRPISGSDSWKIQSTNAYVVISGGDGYRDWKNRQPIQYRNDEAIILAWFVKV